MYIHKLSANYDTFKTITFEPNNINIILGTKSTDNGKTSNNTVNGVGKTLSIKLIDFCLGSRIDSHKILSKLIDWEFTLDLVIDSNEVSVTRKAKTGAVYINGVEKSVTSYTDFLSANCFKSVEDYSYISFRSLISRFLRIPKDAYLKWYKCKGHEDKYASFLNTLYLWNLELELVISKIKIKENINVINKAKSNIKNNDFVRASMSGTNKKIEINHLKKSIAQLKEQLDKFNISEAYNDVQTNISDYTSKKNELINQRTKFKMMINQINNSLDIEVDLTKDKLLEMYEEAAISFSKEVLKTIEDVSNFHDRLLIERKSRLVEDKKSLNKEIYKLNEQIEKYDSDINSLMEFLKDKISVSEYERLHSRYMEMQLTLQRATQHSKTIDDLGLKVAELQKKLADEDLKAIKYENSVNDYIQGVSAKFQSYVDYIYGETKYSGIEINANTDDNKIRFDINIEVQDDGSGGIGNVKLFCVDLLLFEIDERHSIDFIYHDGSLLPEIDPRQIYRMLKLTHRICWDNNKQYIINMNYDVFENIIKVANEEKDEEFSEYLNSCIRMKLYDDSPDKKLLGIQI